MPMSRNILFSWYLLIANQIKIHFKSSANQNLSWMRTEIPAYFSQQTFSRSGLRSNSRRYRHTSLSSIDSQSVFTVDSDVVSALKAIQWYRWVVNRIAKPQRNCKRGVGSTYFFSTVYLTVICFFFFSSLTYYAYYSGNVSSLIDIFWGGS